jgi:hypothetical protein
MCIYIHKCIVLRAMYVCMYIMCVSGDVGIIATSVCARVFVYDDDSEYVCMYVCIYVCMYVCMIITTRPKTQSEMHKKQAKIRQSNIISALEH